MCNFDEAEFDIAASAGWYSGIAGLLAGFAMLAILLPLDHEATEHGKWAERAGSNGVIVFTSAFFALLVLAFTYAILSGRPPGAASVHEKQLGGAAFGLASLLMLVGLREVLRLYGSNRRILKPATTLIARVTGIFGPIMVVAFGLSNALDVAMFRAASAPSDTLCIAGVPDGTWLNVALCGIAVAIIALIPVLGRRVHVGTSATAIIGHLTLGFTLSVAVWTAAIVPFLPSAFVGGAFLEHLVMGITAIGAVIFGATAWLSREFSDSEAS